MSSAVLQWIALLSMVTDHVGYALFPELHVLRSIGRISYPIFAFLLAEGFLHTSSRKKYAARLAVFAVLAEIPYELFLYGELGRVFPMTNILFSMLVAFGAMWCAEQGGAYLLGSGILALGAELGGFSYGAYGVVLTLCFYLCAVSGREPGEKRLSRKARGMVAAALIVCTALYCFFKASLFQSWAVLAALPLLLYHGERGKRMPRYFFYVFYPVHLAALAAAEYFLPY